MLTGSCIFEGMKVFKLHPYLIMLRVHHPSHIFLCETMQGLPGEKKVMDRGLALQE